MIEATHLPTRPFVRGRSCLPLAPLSNSWHHSTAGPPLPRPLMKGVWSAILALRRVRAPLDPQKGCNPLPLNFLFYRPSCDLAADHGTIAWRNYAQETSHSSSS